MTQGSPEPRHPHGFQTTHWSLVASAQGPPSPAAESSLAALCRLYWHPLFTWLRHHGHQEHDAEDLVQEFFARLIAGHWLDAAQPERGRFRTFLLMVLKRFVANQRDHQSALRRGGGVPPLPLTPDWHGDNGPAAPTVDPDSAYDRAWALTVLAQTLATLSDEQEAAGRATEFRLLKPFLTAPRGEVPYHEIAPQLGMTPASARSALHRLRKRFQFVFRSTVAATLHHPEETDDEIRALIAALAAA